MSLKANLENAESLTGTLQGSSTLKGTLSSEEALKGNLSNGVLRGYSAYQVAVLNGYEGTEEEWLTSLKGDDGDTVLFEQYVKDDGNGTLTFLTMQVVEDGEPTKGTTDYNELDNKPTINGVELNGAITLDQLGLIGNGLKFDSETNKLAVNMADDVEQDNTLPCSSSLVYETVGNIKELLKTI